LKRLLHIAYQPYKWLVVVPCLALATIVLGTLAVLLSFVVSSRLVSQLTGVPWAKFMTLLTPMLVTVSGRENVDPGQSYVVVSNHQSQYDIFVLYGWLGVDFRWIMKQELRRAPVLGVACERAGHIFIDRSNRRAAARSLEEAKDKITGGTSVLFFPEGTRSRTGELGVFKRGAFQIAADLGLPVLPVTIRGTREILPPGTLDLFPGRVRLIIHPSLRLGDQGGGTVRELTAEARTRVASALEPTVPEGQ
jgi:1-acyl-sn-glycerol-3-phosphate acyltransferase